jgi:hypothetical protein
VLRAVVLALHHDVGGDVRDAHRRLGLVDVLAAGARGAVDVDAQVGRVDLHFDRLVHLGVDEDVGERGVAARVRVERRLAHQAVHAVLGAQVAVGVFAGDLQRRVLDARDLAVGLLQQLGAKALLVAVLEVHAQQHRGPVLRLGAAGAGLDIHEAVVWVERIGEHAPEFERIDVALELFGVSGNAEQRRVVALGARQLEQLAGICDAAADAPERLDDRLERLLFPADFLRALLVLPELGVFQLLVQGREALFLGLEVKDTSAARPTASAARRASRRSG